MFKKKYIPDQFSGKVTIIYYAIGVSDSNVEHL